MATQCRFFRVLVRGGAVLLHVHIAASHCLKRMVREKSSRALLFVVDVAPVEAILDHAAGSGLGDADAKVLLLGILETGVPPTQHLTCR